MFKLEKIWKIRSELYSHGKKCNFKGNKRMLGVGGEEKTSIV
jgi:hypothetical protein